MEIIQIQQGRGSFIESAKRYVASRGTPESDLPMGGLEIEIDRHERLVYVGPKGYSVKKKYYYPADLVWNKHLVEAYGRAKWTRDEKVIDLILKKSPKPNNTLAKGMVIDAEIKVFGNNTVRFEAEVQEKLQSGRFVLKAPNFLGKTLLLVADSSDVNFNYRIISDSKVNY